MALVHRIISVGPPTRGGADTPVEAQIGGVAKTNDRCPYAIVNELVSEHIGRSLGLPIPPGLLARDGGKVYFLSLDVSAEGKSLPPIVPSEFVAKEPLLSAACVAFDVLIANPDRHAENLARDPGFTPPRISLFDHGSALLGCALPNGLPRLRRLVDELGCDGTSGTRHVLLDHLSTADELLDWVRRIESMPPWAFADACRRAQGEPGIELPQAEGTELAEWLVTRASGIRALINSHRDAFPGVPQWSLEWEATP